MEIIRKGNKGENVRHIQKHLNLIADGIFGKITEEAVKAFQREHGLTADGVVGAKTLEAICDCKPAESEGTQYGLAKTSRKIERIIVHCSATQEGRDVRPWQIKQWHKDRGYADIGYHYVITLDGELHEGRNVNKIGAHTEGYNTTSIGVCYVGGLDLRNNPKDTRTPEQKQTLLRLLKQLHQMYPTAEIIGHYDVSPDKDKNGRVDEWEKIKACPSFDAKSEYKDI